MNLKNNCIFIFILISFFFQSTDACSQNYEPNTMIVKLKNEYRYFFMNHNVAEKLKTDVVKISPVFKSLTKSNNHLSYIYRINYKDAIDALEKSNQWQSSGYFEYCQPVYYETLLYETDDPKAGNQYALFVCKAFEAWDIYKGDSSVVIGITDTGVDFDHPDLSPNIAYNTNDMIDGIDNDQDGYVDNYMGWDLACDDNNPQWNQDGLGNLKHGILTSGFAGARTDNGIGMSSIGFRTKFLPIKISNDEGYLTRAYEGIVYAAQHGCKIINCSWGGTSPTPFGRDVIQYVTEDLGVIVVAAAGNASDEALYYPASYDNVVSVAASNIDDYKWTASSFNWRVDMIAPGENVFSAYSGGGYANRSGTSYASPMVAAALALVYGYYPDTLSNRQLIEILKTTGDVIDTMEYNRPYKNKIGKSRLNIYRALQGNFTYAVNSHNLKLMKGQAPAIIGDTARVHLDITNYLFPMHNLTITLRSLTPQVQLIGDSTFTLSLIGEEETINASDYNIEVLIQDEIFSNQDINFLIRYETDDFYTEEIRQTKVNYPYMDFNINRLTTSIFPDGRIGKNNGGKGQGMFLDSQENILSKMGLVLSHSENYVVSNALYTQDFLVSETVDSSRTDKMWKAESFFYNNSFVPSDVKTEYQILLNDTFDNSMIINYQIINKLGTDYDAFYVGLFADWNIGYSQSNYSETNSDLQMGVTRSFSDNKIAGVQLLSNCPWNHFAFDKTNGNDSIDASNGLGRDEIYWALVSNNHHEGILQNGVDIINLMTAGPLFFGAYDTLNISYGITLDTSMTSLMEEATALSAYFDRELSTSLEPTYTAEDKLVRVYPTLCHDELYIKSKYPLNSVGLYNLQGVLLRSFKPDQNKLSVSGIPTGIYLIKADTYTFKILIQN